MKNYRITIFLFVLFFTSPFFQGCLKFEEGPLISFRTSWNRVQGEYFMAKVLVNDEDKTDDYYNSNAYYTTWKFYECDENSSDKLVCLKVGNGELGTELVYQLEGSYTKRRKNKIFLGCGLNSNYCDSISQFHAYGPINRTLIEWDIIKLKDKEMRCKIDWTDGNTYEIHLKER